MKRKSLPVIIILCAGMVISMAACKENDDIEAENTSSTITVFNYGDYIDRDLLDEFEAETGIEILYEEYVSPEDMYTKYTSGAINYDVIITSDYMIQRLLSEDELLTIDRDSMENIDNIGDTYWEFCSEFDPENQYAVPYLWGTVGIIYNTTMVDDDVDSWNILWDEDYSNSIIMENSVRDAFIPALRLLGYSLNTTDESELQEAADILSDQYDILYAYQVDETRDSMISGEAALAEIYSGDASVAIDSNPDLEYIVPKEGSNIWFDCAVIPKTAQNLDGANKFIDFLCSHDAALANFDYIYYGTPNTSILEDLDADTLSDTTVFPDEETMQDLELFTYLGSETDELYTDLWQIIKTH